MFYSVFKSLILWSIVEVDSRQILSPISIPALLSISITKPQQLKISRTDLEKLFLVSEEARIRWHVIAMTHLTTRKNSIEHPKLHENRDASSLKSFDLEKRKGRNGLELLPSRASFRSQDFCRLKGRLCLFCDRYKK